MSQARRDIVFVVAAFVAIGIAISGVVLGVIAAEQDAAAMATLANFVVAASLLSLCGLLVWYNRGVTGAVGRVVVLSVLGLGFLVSALLAPWLTAPLFELLVEIF